MTITLFKVIQGHRFWYQSKALIRLPISELLYLAVSEIWLIIGKIFTSDRGRFTLTPSLALANNMRINFTSHKLEWLFSYLILKTARSYLHSSGQNSRMWRTDGRTDRSAICCGRAVKRWHHFRRVYISYPPFLSLGRPTTVGRSYVLPLYFATHTLISQTANLCVPRQKCISGWVIMSGTKNWLTSPVHPFPNFYRESKSVACGLKSTCPCLWNTLVFKSSKQSGMDNLSGSQIHNPWLRQWHVVCFYAPCINFLIYLFTPDP